MEYRKGILKTKTKAFAVRVVSSISICHKLKMNI